MKAKYFLLASISLFLWAVVFPVYGYVATFDDGGTNGVYTDVDASGIDLSCISVNDGFIYLSSVVLLGDTYDHAYAGDYDYDYPDIVDSGVWMMDDHIPGDVQGAYIEFSDDVYFEEIWFAQAGDDYPVQGDVAFVTAYSVDDVWLYNASLVFESSNDFNQWFSIGPNPGFENTAIRRLVLSYSNINYGVWDHLVFDTSPGRVVPEPGTVILTSIGVLSVGWLRRRRTL